MSGDVQPRKRKDKKKKKDELGLEEPRGTAAALGEGDVFMHSYSDHGTGGHWCAKIIFFSLLAVLVTLIGLIILENRGLSELEANSVESQYSNLLEGWLEDAPDDDHHDEHTLELKHHDDDEHDDHEHEDDELEVEKIEREASEEEPISLGLPALPEEDDDDDDKDKDDDHDDDDDADDEADDEADNDDDFLEADVPPVVERVSAPAGKPFKEVDEDDDSTEKPPDTLEEEEEYEKQQEEKRKEEEQSSHHIWLKLSVGAALLVATHAVLRRATAPRDQAAKETVEREATPVVDRRMTLIPAQAAPPVNPKKEIEVLEEIVRKEAPVVKTPPVVIKQDSEEEEVEEPELEEVVEEEEIEEDEPEKLEAPHKQTEKDKELYSDEEVEEEEEEVIIPKKETLKAAAPAPKAPAPPKVEPPKPEPEEEEEDADDVEIIDDEALEEELEEEEVSDVDDSELLSRLEAKYGRLPEPERPGRHKDGGNSVEDMWAGEPADAYWRQQLDSAERDLRQDWLD